MANYRGAIGDYSGLSFWFDSVLKTEEHAKWNLYRGHLNKVGENRANQIYKQDDADMSKEDSFDLLMQMIQVNSSEGGDFTIYIPQKSQNVPNGVAFFRAPNTPVRSAYGHSQIAGFPAAGMAGMLTKDDVKEMIEKERDGWEKDRKIEELEAELESKAGIGGMIMQQISQDGTLGKLMEMGVGALIQIASNLATKKTALAGFDHPAGIATQSAPTPAPQGNIDQQIIEYDSDRIVNALDKMVVHFSNVEDFYTALDRLADKFAENPAMYKNLLGV